MKIKIRKYIEIWNIYTFVDKICIFFNVEDDKVIEIFNKIEEIKWLERFNDFINNLNEKINSKKDTIKIDEWDVWNLDITLAKIIYPALLEYKRQIDVYHESTDEFIEALDKMIFSFKVLNEDWEQQFYSEIENNENKPLYETDDNGYIVKINKFFNYDEKGYNAYKDKINEGLKLFGEKYMSLWN